MNVKQVQQAMASGETVTYNGAGYKVTAVIARFGKRKSNTQNVSEPKWWYQAELTDPRRLVDGIPPSLMIVDIEQITHE